MIDPPETRSSNTLRGALDRRWQWLVLLFWLATAAWLFIQHWPQIRWLALGDTDDNMRLMQVRAWLNGQGWYDLRQYRMNPPGGFDIHWTRIVDLPIAGLILLLKPFFGPLMAERLACGIAPLLPLSVTMLGLAFTVRRLVSPVAWPLALVFLVGATATMLMYMPERIDHHGWQLAALSVTVAGLADPRRRRGGAFVGGASAFSLSIGLEMLPYAAAAGAIIALRWVWDRAEATRVAIYGLTLAGGSSLGYLLFASYGNSVARCDALTPVWLSVMVAAGAFLFALARINPERRIIRLIGGIGAGVIIIIGFATLFPQCLGRPEQASPELVKNWLNNVREARPIYQHAFRSAFPVATLPIIGIVGAAFATWRARSTDIFAAWAGVLAFTVASTAMLLWAVRVGPAAMLLAVPGAVALGWALLPRCLGHRNMLVRVFGTVGGFLLVSGLFAGLIVPYLPDGKPDKRTATISRAGATCASLGSLGPLDKLPAQTILTFIDLGPRLITVTHHNAIAGPYHRNGDAILDIQHAFGGTADNFRAIAKRHGATLLLTCPNMAESTVYRFRNKGGFYDQLADGQVPAWLEPVAMPARSPLKLWRIR